MLALILLSPCRAVPGWSISPRVRAPPGILLPALLPTGDRPHRPLLRARVLLSDVSSSLLSVGEKTWNVQPSRTLLTLTAFLPQAVVSLMGSWIPKHDPSPNPPVVGRMLPGGTEHCQSQDPMGIPFPSVPNTRWWSLPLPRCVSWVCVSFLCVGKGGEDGVNS